MAGNYSVKLADVVAQYDELEIVYASSDFDTKLVQSADLNRPGLQLMGFFDYFDPARIQIMGKAEVTLLQGRSEQSCLSSLGELLSRGCPAVVVAHEQEVMPELLEAARRFDVTVLHTEVDTSEFFAQLIGTLRRYLAPRETRHGVLVEVAGEGMLIIGDSGVGKSETALELIKRGHRLIADDAVEILRTSRTTLEGRAPRLIQNFMELRGVGVIDVKSLFGESAVKPETRIDMVVSLEIWNSEKAYDRMGLDTETMDILGVSLPKVTIPVRPGRNLAIILEVTAINNRQKKAGYNAAQVLAQRVDEIADAGIELSGGRF